MKGPDLGNPQLPTVNRRLGHFMLGVIVVLAIPFASCSSDNNASSVLGKAARKSWESSFVRIRSSTTGADEPIIAVDWQHPDRARVLRRVETGSITTIWVKNRAFIFDEMLRGLEMEGDSSNADGKIWNFPLTFVRDFPLIDRTDASVRKIEPNQIEVKWKRSTGGPIQSEAFVCLACRWSYRKD